MIPRAEILKMIVNLDTPHIRVYDISGKQLLWQYSDSGRAQDASDALNEALAWIESYGRVLIHGATEKMKQGSWTGCYKWECALNGNVPAAQTPGRMAGPYQPQSFATQLTEMLTVVRTLNEISGTGNNQNLQLQLQLQKQQYEFQKQMDDLRRQNEMPQWVPALAPTVMRALGMDATVVQQTTNALQQSQPRMVAGPPTMTLSTDLPTLDELSKLSAEELVKECQKTLDQMPSKVDGVKMLFMFKLMNAKPELVDKAINLYQQGLI